MRYYVIAGEASGDLHASNLIKGLRRLDADAEVRGWGGDLMREAGCDIVRHYKDTAIMGFLTVLKNLDKIKTNIEECHRDILEWKPDVVILVDYGGFNLRVAEFIKEAGIRVFYYISPKIWAWNTGRVKKIKRLVDRMFVIFPFEVDFYARYDYPVQYAGNPLVDAIHDRPFKEETFDEFVKANGLSGKPIVALVAGSRSQELKHVLPKMLTMVKHFPDHEFVIAGAPSMSDADYAPYLRDMNVKIVYGQTYRLVKQARAALVTSGTATLETAILRTPQVVCYSGEGGAFSYFLFKTFVKVKYISLVNLIAGREVVTELLMQKLNEKNVLRELSAILPEGEKRNQMLAGYDDVNDKLGDAGASVRFARMMIDDLKA
ncbi:MULTISPECIES: lipid-A-disaccharide synthase [Odoribacteraceae]|uniref:lipid-A-disaccharide synthase n=1 Tax=Odoribacteraceae TaxID=1853231 RepID=UPI000E47A401|nr:MULTISPECIES: lipid-A-disaccharide synthase [Odoribacteraceae]MCQ4874246.1 lipid-A-disaccharide synthase [Butyricimonas paravirosa]RHR74810.1 lipid-A-disaccharide synthase [Odoribacter sp. AF15-53]